MLVFVYNANSGLFNALGDLAHRIVSPKTYPCNLCVITYSISGMRSEWEQFLHTLKMPYEFLHRDELEGRFDLEGVRLPAIFNSEGGRLSVWIDTDAINSCHNLNDLKQLITNKMAL